MSEQDEEEKIVGMIYIALAIGFCAGFLLGCITIGITYLK